MAEDFCFEIIFEICGWIILSVLWEIGIEVLVSMGMSRSGAEGCLFVFALGFVLLLIVATARRRKLLGKAVVLDTDGDGYVSEEEWADAGQDMDEDTDEEEAGAPSSEDDTQESEEDDGWWEEEGEEK
tara:strand:+ start:112 stop:495 length:384 start_codon:yes stop_codon:yes gene_type:complete